MREIESDLALCTAGSLWFHTQVIRVLYHRVRPNDVAEILWHDQSPAYSYWDSRSHVSSLVDCMKWRSCTVRVTTPKLSSTNPRTTYMHDTLLA